MEYVPQEGIDYIVDLYAIAGVEPNAAETDLKSALNTRALEYHPDRLQGLAPEFIDKGERMARLLNRARGILLDPEKRSEYDEILASWDGPVSQDGTPKMTIRRYAEIRLRGKTPEEVEEILAKDIERILNLSGYDPRRLTFLESLMEQAGDDASDDLRAEYEAALLEYDYVLAAEEAERSKLLGLPDIDDSDYVAELNYGKRIAYEIETARETEKARLELHTLGGAATKLALLSGEEVPAVTLTTLNAEPMTVEGLPIYFEDQAAKVIKIAEERGSIADKRLSNFRPTYPEAELQTEMKENLIVGIFNDDGYVWMNAKIDLEIDLVEFEEVGPELKKLLSHGDYKSVIERGYAVMSFELMKSIHRHELVGVAIGSYIDKFKEANK